MAKDSILSPSWKLTLVIGAPQIVRAQAIGNRRTSASRARPGHSLHQAEAIEYGMDRARRRYFDRVRQTSQQALTDLTHPPMRLLALSCDDRRLHRSRQLVGLPERQTCPIAESFQVAFLVALEDLVSCLARDPELPSQRSHASASFAPNDKPHSFIHNRTLLPWHLLLCLPPGEKV